MSPDDENDLLGLLRNLVREGMDRKGWSQIQLAQENGLSEQHVSRLMKGKTAGSLYTWDRLLKSVREDEEGKEP